MNSIIRIIVTILSIFIMNQTSAEEKITNPIYYLNFSIHGTGAEIRLNDIPVLYNKDAGTTKSMKPIPESIIDGKNILTIKTFHLKDGEKFMENSYAEATITVSERNAPLNKQKTLVQLHINPGLQDDKLLKGTERASGNNDSHITVHTEKEILAERSVDIQSPYPRWAWQDGQIIENTSDNYESLSNVYKEIYEALKAEDKEKIYELYQPAAQEYAYAYNYQDPQQGHRIMDTGGFIGDPDWILGDTLTLLHNMPFHLHIFANGLLANIVDNKHGKEPILYVERETKNLAFQKFAFYKNKDGKWVMIR